jgi:nicotinamide-nucleotide amidase
MDSENPTVAPYAHPGEVHLRVTARAKTREDAERLIEPVYGKIKQILGDALFGVDDMTLEHAVIDLLTEKQSTVSVAESMTGGGLGERLTSVPGSSSVFVGGAITYGARAKQVLLPDSEPLRTFGPVSPEVAREMATAIRESLQTTYAVSITGNAGPTADLDNKPVGLVFIGVAGPAGCEVEELRYRGERADIRRRATQAALVGLRNALLKA